MYYCVVVYIGGVSFFFSSLLAIAAAAVDRNGARPKGISGRRSNSSSREDERDDSRLPGVYVHRPGGLGLRVPRGKDAHVRLGKHDGHHPWASREA